jgi:environmental stress-induced protein Ves
LKLLRRADYKAIPWKNGRGIAHQIAVFPPGAGYGQLDWQVSRPEIALDGPFSSFPGLDRQFMLVAGNGLTLRIRSRDEGLAFDRAVTRPLEPFAVRGEWDVECVLQDGPVQVFNVMTRRGYAGARLEIAEVAAGRPIAKPAGETLIVYVARGPIEAWGRWGKAMLAADDSILVDEDGATELALAPVEGRAAHLALVRLHTERR